MITRKTLDLVTISASGVAMAVAILFIVIGVNNSPDVHPATTGFNTVVLVGLCSTLHLRIRDRRRR